jgi:AraC family transcriptional regulator
MQPRIEILKNKKLVGKHIRMSLQQNRTAELWRSFMPEKHRIKNNIGSSLYSVEVYDQHYFENFNPGAEFDKWATIEVSDFDSVPEGMDTLELDGLYAVFVHKGLTSEASKTFLYIFQEWLPASEYMLDDRPHFEIMDDKYKHEDLSSEEELWIPVKRK